MDNQPYYRSLSLVPHVLCLWLYPLFLRFSLSLMRSLFSLVFLNSCPFLSLSPLMFSSSVYLWSFFLSFSRFVFSHFFLNSVSLAQLIHSANASPPPFPLSVHLLIFNLPLSALLFGGRPGSPSYRSLSPLIFHCSLPLSLSSLCRF